MRWVHGIFSSVALKSPARLKNLDSLSRIVTFALIASSIPVVTACDFRPLTEAGNTHYVRVYIDEHIPNTTEGFYDDTHAKPAYRRPEVMRVALADKATGRVVAERYLRNQGNDPQGHYYDGYIICDPGEWSLLAWNFDTEATLISSPSNIEEAKAYTNTIAAHLYSALRASLAAAKSGASKSEESAESVSKESVSKAEIDLDNEKVVYEPDHLFVAKEENASIGYSETIDTLRTADREYFTASSIVEAWYIQVNVKGISRVSSSIALLSGLSGSKKLVTGELDPNDPVINYFEMNSTDVTKADEDTGVLYTTFHTFGKLPEHSNGFKVTFDVTTKAGQAVSATFDITDEFSKDIAKERRWIILDRTIVIPDVPPGDQNGGFSPGVKDWSDVNTDLEI